MSRYEEAGYTGTGETREQSEGKITLAYKEKHIPPFRDIKAQIGNPAVQQILIFCMGKRTPEGYTEEFDRYRNDDTRQLYGWVKKGEIVGVCGFEIHPDYVEILHIAVAENARQHGIGGKMVSALADKYHRLAIEAETDDDAVDFYRKTGFQTTSIQKYGIRRWTCVKSSGS